ncbi:MAG: M3 family oligoendopeptidase [Candidatus Dadabacteria bacterium]|nr:MAG: M3 family oligoendopeptidase [Candidatus Dadabacteria bacterium]
MLDRSIASAVRLYRDENVPLLTRDTELSADYDKITGAMTVSIDGKELTLEEAAALLREPDRQRRQDAWEKIYNRWHQDHDRLDELYDEMVQLRDRIAKNAGFSNFRDYTFEAMERFDYTPRDCEKLHQAVEEVVVPLARELVEARKKALGVDKVRPWDMHVDPENRPALKPYNGAKELVAKVIEAMRRIDPEFADYAQEMADREDLDLSSRPGKSGGGYMETFDEVRRPFIFMNEVGTHDDAMTLAHELGHSFHALLARNDPIVEYRHAPLEFSEVASMGSEQFMLSVLDVFYSEEDKKRAVADSFEDIILFLPYCMQVDAFQHWVYLNPEASSAERDNEWHKLGERFGTGVDWSGYEQLEESGWHYKLHIFTMPFYYFEYAVAQLGALQLRENFKNDPDKTIAEYRRGLSLGGSRPLPELFEAAGIKFDFSEDMLRHLIDGLRKELINLGRLPADR